MSLRIFISYARADDLALNRFVDELRGAGLDTWTDQQLRPAESWSSQIARAIRRSDVVVVLLSAHSVRSEWVEMEVLCAVKARRPIVGVRIDRSEDWGALDLLISRTQTVSYDPAGSPYKVLDAIYHARPEVPPPNFWATVGWVVAAILTVLGTIALLIGFGGMVWGIAGAISATAAGECDVAGPCAAWATGLHRFFAFLVPFLAAFVLLIVGTVLRRTVAWR